MVSLRCVPGHEPIATLFELSDTVTGEDKLVHALDTLEKAHGALPVVDTANGPVVGWLTIKAS